MHEYLNSSNIVPNNSCRGDHPNISPWLDEQIWGHRIWDNQSPWLLFLEFLTVAEACLREGKLFQEESTNYPLLFQPYKRLYLRNILFNNEFIGSIKRQHSNQETWDTWIERMNNQAQGIPIRDFSYLKNKFYSFRDFATVVEMLQSTAVEGNRNRRWSSRFVFPFGPDGLYEDLNVKGSSVSREYINFGRTGELLYLMLSRSKSAKVLRVPMESLFHNNVLNQLLKSLQPNLSDDLQRRGQSYLPYIEHKCYDTLGEDWKSIFDLNLPEFDAYQYLVALCAFHIMLYQLNTASWFIPDGYKVYFICEVIAPKKTLVRELSINNYQQNNLLTTRTVEAYISRISKSDNWQTAIENSTAAAAFVKCKEILQNELWWPVSYEGQSNVTALISELKEAAKKRHRQHAANVHRTYGTAIGLISRRSTNRLRYAPSDTFLKTLVVANVKGHVEFSEFLTNLYNRYGLVFGEQEASIVLTAAEFDQKVFQSNTERLEQRLSSMGMLRRFSDACAYVINPFTKEEQ